MSGIGMLVDSRRYGPYRSEDGAVTFVTLELRRRDDGRVYASFAGEERGPEPGDWAGGQHQGSAPEALKALWDRWHLNDMRAGCTHQEARFREHPEDRPTWRNGYRGASGHTLSPEEGSACAECGYAYGSKWLYEPLPDDFMALADDAARE